MSCTSELNDKNSALRKWFYENQNTEQLSRYNKYLQSNLPIILPIGPEIPPAGFKFIGTVVDYLIRYAANGNKLDFQNTIAMNAVRSPSSNNTIKGYFLIGKWHLCGEHPASQAAIYSATALTILDGYYRSGSLPFDFAYRKISDKMIRNCDIADINEQLKENLEGFIEKYGGDYYYNDIANIIRRFRENLLNACGQLYGAKLVNGDNEFNNSIFVGGADFDCIIHHKDKKVLTEIKTSKNNTTIKNLRQLLTYALLYDPELDFFEIDSIGFYHSRSGSFRYIDIDNTILNVFPGFKSVTDARKSFINAISK
ncbi:MULTISPECIES: hypothetical protein [Methylomonas]|uniref:hypothetical protein n=1 Tax=Methylomonas TaxID=416 RepID=UPI000AB71864|nr:MULTISPECIES: hypothetical protein [Methylomonas]ATG89444.1 hypothetical protein MKLM6_1187 [Methylomonas koyamae]